MVLQPYQHPPNNGHPHAVLSHLPAECVCFFFQAEDGIRDLTVTGVQTCALPILASRTTIRSMRCVLPGSARTRRGGSARAERVSSVLQAMVLSADRQVSETSAPSEIGRASCRERV